MKKICRLLFAMLIVAMVLGGCGKANTSDTEIDTQQTDTEKETPHAHAYTEAITTEAMCEADGVKTFACECGDSYTEAIKAIGHDYEDVITAPTCSEKGYTTHTCKTCGNAYTDTEVSASGHVYGGYTYNNDATYDKDGTETATCSICGNKDTRTKAGTKLVKEEPECPYELGVWYDMGWYFFKLIPSQADFTYGAVEQFQILRERYPNSESAEGGCYTKWGNYVHVVATYPLQGSYVFN